MVVEKAFLSFLRADAGCMSALSGGLFYGQAPEGCSEPFGVLNLVSEGGVREAGCFFPLMQLDVYHAAIHQAAESAESIVQSIENGRGVAGVAYIQGVRCRRAPAIRCEDGTWKVPIDIRFNCRRA